MGVTTHACKRDDTARCTVTAAMIHACTHGEAAQCTVTAANTRACNDAPSLTPHARTRGGVA
eukprot:357108-Chlamydomonas_euryale.AAC.4